MGTWGPGPFDNDAAADFLDAARASAPRTVSSALRAVIEAPAGAYIDVDDGGAAHAACELVALAFGQGDPADVDDATLEIVRRLKPKEEHRTLALRALPRIADPATSELAGLWAEGADGPHFQARLGALEARLQAAATGPRAWPKPKAGDVLLLTAAAGTLLVVQVVGTGEVAVFEGAVADEAAAREAVRIRPARRVPTSVSRWFHRARWLENLPLRKDLKGKKLYAAEAGAIEGYALFTAAGGTPRMVAYEEAATHDLLRHHDVEALSAVARGALPPERVRSPDVREAELRARHRARWAERRANTTPGPFGDLAALEELVGWVETCGVAHAVSNFGDLVAERWGYGRPSEGSERRPYAFAGMVAIWCGAWPESAWPRALAGRLPPTPAADLMARALATARVLAGQVILREAELRLIWDETPEGSAELRRVVAELRRALR